MANSNTKAIKNYIIENFGNKAPDILRKSSLLKGISNAMGCRTYLFHDPTHPRQFSFTTVKDFNFGDVKLNKIVVWKSSRFNRLDKALDEFLNAFRCKNAHFVDLEFLNESGNCDIKLDVPYYETDDELQMKCVLAGSWNDIAAA